MGVTEPGINPVSLDNAPVGKKTNKSRYCQRNRFHSTVLFLCDADFLPVIGKLRQADRFSSATFCLRRNASKLNSACVSDGAGFLGKYVGFGGIY